MIRAPARPTFYAVCAAICLAALSPALVPGAGAQDIRVADVGLHANFQNHFFDQFKRGRPAIMADFDLDGRIDAYLGSFGDQGVVVLNQPDEAGMPVFRLFQLLLDGEFNWGGAAADYDDDGDYDLFLTSGFGGGTGFNYLFKNLLIEEGDLRFVDVAESAGVRGAIPPGGGAPEPVENASAVWGDYDRDGDVDLFVNVNVDTGVESAGDLPGDGSATPRFEGGSYPPGRNILWRNEGDGTFVDVTDAVGLGADLRPTRHSTFFDADDDGDIDLYENNFGAENVLWRNMLVESGEAVFTDATDAYSGPGESLAEPFGSFVSCAADFDQDGREDLVAFQRGAGDDGPYPPGHALFLNRGPAGFFNVAGLAGLNDPYISEDGVMGTMVGDVDGDGLPDVYIGNGGPDADAGAQFDQLYLTDALSSAAPLFTNRSDLIDFPAPEQPEIPYPPYPYRTHATNFVDVDGDGSLEILVANGGFHPEDKEPNRLFRLSLPEPRSWLAVQPVGDGVAVSRDAIGTRVALTVSGPDGPPRTFHRTLYGGQCFSAQKGFAVHFYAGVADSVEQLRVLWPDGRADIVADPIELGTKIVVQRTSTGAVVR